ncbi:helix-turn-helix transcriptional regulator [Pontixanthobacter gangjinensis]|uniref:Helix-turn-helix domain-containing protein n=1 Tax=Pontixanthobacter gangjinensis TaxID=1028742 RepID=A0A6I4SIT9_9SPHN|nr:helix-turn-helix transcriptional regulator [Pontixanthobacter gangjinensis]MXO55298.1 helix-turn-helix domain-containing protein [Pontixanthobacter gangjinensis]
MKLRDNLAANLKRIRREREMSQDDFAALVDVHRTYINHLEHSKRSPTIDVIERIAGNLGITATDLLEEPPSKPPQL